MITITCTEAERDLIISKMNLNEFDTRIPVYGTDIKVPVNFIVATESQTEKVGEILNRYYPWGEV